MYRERRWQQKEVKGRELATLVSNLKSILFVLILSFMVTPVAGEDKKDHVSTHNWREWLGRKVDVDYQACDPTGCVLVRRATLKDVTDEAIVVIVNDSPFYIPKYMIEAVNLSK